MASGTCKQCGRTFKNIGNHRCKSNKSQSLDGGISIPKSISPPAASIDTSQSSGGNDPYPTTKKHALDNSLTNSARDNIAKSTWWERNVSHKKEYREWMKPKTKEVLNPEDLISGLKPYEIPENNPKTGLGKIKNKDKDYIQVVLVSELIEPKTFWCEKTGMNRIQYKDRMYKLPRDIRGNVFFWHVDKKQPLIDTANATQGDAESSFHELQLFNMAYSVGRAAGANDLLNNLKLILIIVGFMCILAILTLIYLNRIDKSMGTDYSDIMTTLRIMNQTINRMV